MCFLAGLFLAASVLLCAVLIPALSTARFEKALRDTVPAEALGIAESDLSAFAEATMRYLRGELPRWDVRIPPQGVSEAFRQHMAEVRGWVSAAPWVIAAGLLLGLVLLWLGGRRRGPALLGVGALLAVLAAAAVWAAVDFGSLWMLLHRWFIPGGIFSAAEPVMQLFPLALFFRYVIPVCLWAAGLTAALCAGMWIFLQPRKM